MNARTEALSSTETQLYPIRWFIIVLIAIATMTLRILRYSFGVVNIVFATYFNVPLKTVDWFTLIQIPGWIFSGIILTIRSLKGKNDTRKISIAMCFCFCFASLCLLIAFLFPVSYPLILVGELVIGFAVISIDLVSSAFAISWFPEHQVGIALSAKEIGGNVGSLLAFLVPTQLLTTPNFNSTTCQNDANVSSDLEGSSKQQWFLDTKLRLVAFASALLVLSILLFVLFALFISEKPPKPPTIAQNAVQNENAKHVNNAEAKNFRKLFEELLTILKNIFMLQVAFVYTINLTLNNIQKVYMGEVLRSLFEETDSKSMLQNSLSFSGYILMLYEVGCIGGNIASGKVIDYYKNYALQISMGNFLTLVSLVCLFLAYYFESVVAVYLLITVFGFFLVSMYTQHFEIVYQHMYPIDPSLLVLVLRLETSLITILFTAITRVFLSRFGDISVFVYMSVLLVLAIFVSLFLKPVYRRLNVMSNFQSSSENEETPLIRPVE